MPKKSKCKITDKIQSIEMRTISDLLVKMNVGNGERKGEPISLNGGVSTQRENEKKFVEMGGNLY